MKGRSPRPSPTGIEPGVIYHVEELKRRLGWGTYAMRSARRAGLRVIYTAGRAYVRGDDAIAYFHDVGGQGEGRP